jgi:hypothetical protein
MIKKPLEFVVHPDSSIELLGIPERTPEQLAERKRFATLCGHVTRKLMKNERLTGNVLECALSAAGDEKVEEKLKKGEPLSDYEKHLMIDVWMLHLRLGA